LNDYTYNLSVLYIRDYIFLFLSESNLLPMPWIVKPYRVELSEIARYNVAPGDSIYAPGDLVLGY